METKQTPKTIARATYAHIGGTERGLTYGINRDGKHVIVVGWSAGEDLNPDFYRFDTIEEARACW